MCKLSNQIILLSHLSCPLPPSVQGPEYYGPAEFYYTLDGKDWHRIVQGFAYYEQPVVSQVMPSFMPKEGGRVTVKGKHFVNDYHGTQLTCRIGNNVAVANLTSENQADCNFKDLDISPDEEQYLQVALNKVSYTNKTSATRMDIFQVTSMTPQSGVLEGGTQVIYFIFLLPYKPLQVHIEGINFPANSVPLCQFGVKRRSEITYGKLLTPQQILCTAPSVDLPAVADYPLEVMFALNFNDTSYSKYICLTIHVIP